MKFLEYATKVLNNVIEERVRKFMKTDIMQFGFMLGRSTTDDIFIVWQLQEKYLAKSKDLVMKDNLWKAFDDLGMEAEIQLLLKRSSRVQCLFPNPSWLV